MEVVAIAFLVAMAIWFFAIWRSRQEHMKHPPRGRPDA
jgi:preprotein translocase subunit YajC